MCTIIAAATATEVHGGSSSSSSTSHISSSGSSYTQLHRYDVHIFNGSNPNGRKESQQQGLVRKHPGQQEGADPATATASDTARTSQVAEAGGHRLFTLCSRAIDRPRPATRSCDRRMYALQQRALCAQHSSLQQTSQLTAHGLLTCRRQSPPTFGRHYRPRPLGRRSSRPPASWL